MSSTVSQQCLKALALSVFILVGVSTQATWAATLRVGYGGAGGPGAAQADLSRVEDQFIRQLGELAQLEVVKDARTRTLLADCRDSALSGEVGCLRAVGEERALQAVVYLSVFAGATGAGPQATGLRVKAVVLHTVAPSPLVLPTPSFALSDPQVVQYLTSAVCSLLPPIGAVGGVIRIGEEVSVQFYLEDDMRRGVHEGDVYELHQPLSTGVLKLTSPDGTQEDVKVQLAGAHVGTVSVTGIEQNGWVNATPRDKSFIPSLGTLVMAAPAGSGAFGGQARGTIVLSMPPEAECRTIHGSMGITPVLLSPGMLEGDRSIVLVKEGHEQLTAEVPPEVDALRYWRKELTRIPPFGSLSISTEPSGAQVSLDGVVRGVTPLALPRVPAGEHQLELTLAEHRKYQAPVIVRIREETTVAVALKRTARSVNINSAPEGALVRLGEEVLGRTPLENVSIPFGTHKLEFSLENYEPAELVLELTKEETPDPILMHLVPSPGSLTLISTPSGARVWLDGREVGNTPLEISHVTAGNHVLEVTKSGHLTDRRTVEVLPGQAKREVIHLQQLTGLLTVTSLPNGANVLMDGTPLGQTPVTNHRVPVGKHTLVISNSGYQTWRSRISILSEEQTEVSVALTKYEDASTSPSASSEAPLDKPIITSQLNRVTDGTPAELQLTMKYDPLSGRAICSLNLSREFPEDTRTIATDELVAIVIPGFAVDGERRKVELSVGPFSAVQIGCQSRRQERVRVELTLLCRSEVKFEFARGGHLDIIVEPVHANGHLYTDKRIAFTFDDFPFQGSDQLLDCLDELEITGTLFAIGNKVERYPDIVRRAALAGHRIENHSYAHNRLSMMNNDELVADLRHCNQEILRVTGRTPQLFRPPGGRYFPSQNSMLKKLGLSVCWWTVNTADYKYRDADVIGRAILNGARPGAIVLLHDGIPATLQALRHVVPILRAWGYSFVAVQELNGVTEAQVARHSEL
ncbi:MAG: PEGA domain-containing protein [Armatimonadetes bacterium]|nr:PEGA domain-containing protein [Armatimonadota bacterium]